MLDFTLKGLKQGIGGSYVGITANAGVPRMHILPMNVVLSHAVLWHLGDSPTPRHHHRFISFSKRCPNVLSFGLVYSTKALRSESDTSSLRSR